MISLFEGVLKLVLNVVACISKLHSQNTIGQSNQHKVVVLVGSSATLPVVHDSNAEYMCI